ncbi:MAG: hypothetical protein J6W64_04500 [Bacilli bacterium]|nr:hypothetical protein [Bacilli bacterium]
MRYMEVKGNVHQTYDVSFDKEKLKLLLDEIIRNCSYLAVGKYNIDYGASSIKTNKDKTEIVSGAELINGDPAFVDIKKISYYKYEHPGDSITIEGAKVIIPQLATIIDKLMNQYQNSLYPLIEYPSNVELVPIDEQIATLNSEIKAMGDFDIDAKIGALTRLKELVYRKANNEFYDPELLKSYYEKAISLISFKLFTTTTYHDGPEYSFDQLFGKKDEVPSTSKGK